MLHHEVLKLSVCLGVVLSEVMRQLVRSSQQYSGLLRRLGCPGVYVEVHRPVAVESVRALVLAVLLLGLVQYHVHSHGLGHRLEYAQLRVTHHVLCRRPVCHALILHALETDCTLAALARGAVLYAAVLAVATGVKGAAELFVREYCRSPAVSPARLLRLLLGKGCGLAVDIRHCIESQRVGLRFHLLISQRVGLEHFVSVGRRAEGVEYSLSVGVEYRLPFHHV